jgi:hypothetical protein
MRLFVSVLFLSLTFPADADNTYDFGDVRLAPLADPVQVSYPAGAAPSVEKLREVVAVVAPSRDWRVVSESEGRMALERNVRNKHEMRVELRHDPRGFRLRYVSSVNLLYRDYQHGAAGFALIHHNYNTWVEELAAAIAKSLGIATPPVAGFAPLESVDAVPYVRENGRKSYAEFLDRMTPRAFAIAPNGAFGWSAPLKPAAYIRRDRFDPVENALENCNRGGEGKCRLYAIDGRVVWRGDL